MQTIEQPSAPVSLKTNWPHVAWFLGVTFGLTWLVDLALYLNGGLTNPGTMLLLQFQILLPAFSIIPACHNRPAAFLDRRCCAVIAPG